MIIHHVEQGSIHWHQVRLGIPTAHRFHQIITPKKAKLSAGARTYMMRLVCERMLQEAMEDELERVDWIERGTMMEPHAVQALCKQLNVRVEPGGFYTDDRARWGCSPDAKVIGRNEAAEVKCPQPWTQMERLLHLADPKEYPMEEKFKPQVQGQLFVGEFESVHFYSWHPAMPPFYLQTLRDEEYIAKLGSALMEFSLELDKAANHARKMGGFMAKRPVSQNSDAAGDGGVSAPLGR